MISAKILLDSITDGGSRLITWELTYGRLFHSEVLTHGALARNSASSRAIPMAKLRGMVETEPFMHHHWGTAQKGMQAGDEIADIEAAKDWWLSARNLMVAKHAEGERLGLAKQVVNRIIEPWMNITVILSATDYANFFHLRNSPLAEPSFGELARQMWEAFHESTPTYRAVNEWHLPMIDDADRAAVRELQKNDYEDWATESFRTECVNNTLKKVSVGRCARVSYLTHHGVRDLADDVALCERLASCGHWSPFEHVASAIGGRKRDKKFEGWRQYRADFAHENGPSTDDRCERCGCWEQRHTKNCPNKKETV